MTWEKQGDTSEYVFSVLDEDGGLRADAKWDGCVHLWMFWNGYKDIGDESTDYIHICELKDFIERLQQLLQDATDYFNTDEKARHAAEYWPQTAKRPGP